MQHPALEAQTRRLEVGIAEAPGERGIKGLVLGEPPGRPRLDPEVQQVTGIMRDRCGCMRMWIHGWITVYPASATVHHPGQDQDDVWEQGHEDDSEVEHQEKR